MSMIFILIQAKFDIDINNDDLLENIWEHKKRGKKELIIVCNVQQHEAQVVIDSYKLVEEVYMHIKYLNLLHRIYILQ